MALLWATYGPGVRFLLACTPAHGGVPVRPSSLQAVRVLVSLAALLAIHALAPHLQRPVPGSPAGIAGVAGEKPPRELLHREELLRGEEVRGGPEPTVGPRLGPFAAGTEVGIWDFAGGALEASALANAPASRAALAMASVSVIVPALSAAAGEAVPPHVWTACALATAGAVTLATAGGEGGSDRRCDPPATSGEDALHASGDGFGSWGAAGSESSAPLDWLPGSSNAASSADFPSFCIGAGDLLVLAAAFCYAQATVRLRRHAQAHAPGRLASASLATNAALSLAWEAAARAAATNPAAGPGLGGEAVTVIDEATVADHVHSFLSAVGGALAEYAHLFDGAPAFAWPLLLFLALGSGTAASFVLARGLAGLPASEAQLILASVPLLSVAVAVVALGEAMPPAAWAGGAALVAASVVAAAPWRGDRSQSPHH